MLQQIRASVADLLLRLSIIRISVAAPIVEAVPELVAFSIPLLLPAIFALIHCPY